MVGEPCIISGTGVLRQSLHANGAGGGCGSAPFVLKRCKPLPKAWSACRVVLASAGVALAAVITGAVVWLVRAHRSSGAAGGGGRLGGSGGSGAWTWRRARVHRRAGRGGGQRARVCGRAGCGGGQRARVGVWWPARPPAERGARAGTDAAAVAVQQQQRLPGGLGRARRHHNHAAGGHACAWREGSAGASARCLVQRLAW